MSSTADEDSLKKQENPFIPNHTYQPENNDRKNLRYYFAQYCSATSIHGIQYLGERSRYIVERIFWTVVIITVSSLCLTLIIKTYNKWKTSPVIVTFSTTETSVSTIPFPAITVCPQVKADPAVFNYTDVYIKKIMLHNLTLAEQELSESISLVCSNIDPEVQILGDKDFVEDEDVALLITSTPSLDPINISYVEWIGVRKPVDEYMDIIFTSEGICYSFNMLNINEILKDPEEYTAKPSAKAKTIKEWTLDKGYPDIPINESYPRRTVLTGVDGGFVYDSMFVNNSHLDYLCGDSLQGFKVVLHHPADWPDLDKHFRLPLDTAVQVGIKPKLTVISDELASYTPTERKCYLTDEKQLLYFKVYTQSNCLQECFANYTLKKCDCQAFYMPKFHDGPICGAGKRQCIQKSKVLFMKEDKETCACLPSCTALEYDLELSQTEWNWQETFNVFRKIGLQEALSDYEGIHLSKLSVYFQEMQFLSAERHELYGIVDFFSNVGGLCGLFIGISVTSFIEILYFCTLRLWCNYKRYGRRYWSGEPELLEAKDK